MIDDMTILAAARWLADHEWESGEPRSASRSVHRQGEWAKQLEAARDHAKRREDSPGDKIGAATPSGPRKDGRAPIASVHIIENKVFGYLDDERKPSFLWPSTP